MEIPTTYTNKIKMEDGKIKAFIARLEKYHHDCRPDGTYYPEWSIKAVLKDWNV